MINRQHLFMLVLAALFTGLNGVLAQISIPIPITEIPFSLQVLGVTLTAVLLGKYYGTISIGLYLLVGALGFPVFAMQKAGLGVLLGPTGGYLFGFLIAAFIIGFLVEKLPFNFFSLLFANFIGILIIYSLGVSQLKLVLDMTWSKAFIAGALPFIPLDLIKIVITSLIALEVIKRLPYKPYKIILKS